jgi:glucose/arabinose dehydrogenase
VAQGATPKPVVVARGFDEPTDLAAAPGEAGRLYVVEQPGTIRVIQNGKVLATPFLDIHDLVSSGGERGLLSAAFSPDYAKSRLFYVDYTDTNGDTRGWSIPLRTTAIVVARLWRRKRSRAATAVRWSWA